MEIYPPLLSCRQSTVSSSVLNYEITWESNQ